MPLRHYTLTSLRYLKASISNLGHPAFWGTAVFLCVTGFAIREYKLLPDLFTAKENTQVTFQKPVETALSKEEKAMMADIDNLPVLLNEFDKATLSSPPVDFKERTQEKNQNLLENILNKQNAAAKEAKSDFSMSKVSTLTKSDQKNPFLEQAEKLLQSGTSDSGSQFIGVKPLATSSEQTDTKTTSTLGMRLLNNTAKNQIPILPNPLQSEIDKSIAQNLSKLNNSTSTQSPLGKTSNFESIMVQPNNTSPSQGLPAIRGVENIQPNLTTQPETPYSNLNGVQPIPSLFPINPVVGSSMPPTQNVVIPSTPVGYANYGYGNYGTQPQPTQLPQSTPSNSSLQQPTQLPQSNYSYPSLRRQYRYGN